MKIRKSFLISGIGALLLLVLLAGLANGFVSFQHGLRRFGGVRRTDNKAEVRYRLGLPSRVAASLVEHGCSPARIRTLVVPGATAADGTGEAAPLPASAPPAAVEPAPPPDPGSSPADALSPDPVTAAGATAPPPRVSAAAAEQVLPADLPVESFDYWIYDLATAPAPSAQLRVAFEHATGAVRSVSCVESAEQGVPACPALAGITPGTSQERLQVVLGQPTTQSLDRGIKTLGYEDLGLTYVLTQGKVCMLEQEALPQEVPVRALWRYLLSQVADYRHVD